MILVKKRHIWTRQPQNTVSVDGSNPFGKQRFAMVHVPGIALFGSANPVVTARTNAVTRLGAGGQSLVYTAAVANGGFTYGANNGLQLDTLSGLCIFYSPSPPCNLFGTTWDGFGGGFLIRANPSSKIELVKHEVALILESSNTIRSNALNSVAWSYNNSTGRARVAVNGVLSSGTSAQTFTHNTVATLGYYSFSGAGAAPGEISLLAISPDECLDDRALIDASLNPWAIFVNPNRRYVFVESSGGGDVSLALSGSTGSTATGALSPSISASVSGQSATTATGAAAPEISKALTGSASTTATGAAAPAISKALTGSASTTATGAAAPAISKELTGSAATTATGAAVPAISKAITGSAATTATGALTPDGAIAGTGVTTATGALSPALSKAIEGQAATTSVGTLSVTLSSALAGVASVTSAGSLTAQTADTVLSGQQTTTTTGALAASITTTLTGVASTVDAGALTAIQNPVSGVETTTAVGLLTPSLTLGLSGRQATSSAGYLDSGAPTFREVVYLKSGIRTSVTLSSPLSS